MYKNKQEAIIYISPSIKNPYNKSVAAEYQLISERFQKIGITFVYLPDLLTDLHFSQVMDYHYPYLRNDFLTDSGKLYQQLRKHFEVTSENPILLYVSEKDDIVQTFELFSDTDEITKEQIFDEIERISEKIILIKTEIQEKKRFDSGIRFRMRNAPFDGLFVEEDEYFKKDADENFVREAFELPEDLITKIDKLKEAGYLHKLIEYLEIIEKKSKKYSRLKITKDYKLYLMDYGMREIKMSPLPRALYLLFLNHPEGILFKELTDYRTELMNIYKEISLRENPDEARDSIRRMTDPFDNSVNEKCSMIRTAFLRVISEDLAKNYYVTGNRGEPKCIKLDRELVIYEQ